MKKNNLCNLNSKTFLLLMLVFCFTLVKAQHKKIRQQINARGEVYLLIDVPNQNTLYKLSKVSSIDKSVFDSNSKKVYAYLNKNQLDDFEKLDLNYSVQTAPSLKIAATMCPDADHVKNWDCYPTYNQYISLMNEFVANFPDLCQLEEIGTSVDGRSVMSMKISDNVAQNEEEPAFFYTSTMHGDETAGYVLMLRLIDYLLNNYNSDTRIKELVDNTEIWINPLANPDGTYALGNSEINGATRANANGIDLNRNFPDPQAGDYPNGARQKETQDMMDFMSTRCFVLAANFHGGAEVVNYPWDTWYERHADDGWYQDVSHQYADTVLLNSAAYMTGFTNGVTNGYDWYPISGGRQDYVNYYLHGRETTIELSNNKVAAASSLPNLWEYNYRSLLNYIGRVHLGLYGKITDVGGNPLKAKVEIVGHDVDSSEVYSNSTNGMYYRLLMGGNYSVSYTAMGYVAKTINDINFSNAEHKKVDVILEKIPAAINKINNRRISLKSINNPFNSYIQFKLYNTGFTGKHSISLYDLQGRRYINIQNGSEIIKNGSYYLHTHKLKPGIYILKLQSPGVTIKKKLVKM